MKRVPNVATVSMVPGIPNVQSPLLQVKERISYYATHRTVGGKAAQSSRGENGEGRFETCRYKAPS